MAFAILVTFWMSSFIVFLLELLLTWIKPDLPSKTIFNYESSSMTSTSATEELLLELRQELRQLKRELQFCICKPSLIKYPNKISTLDSASMKFPGCPELIVNILVVTVQRLVFNLTFAKVALPLCFFFFILLLHPHTEIQVFIFTSLWICNLNPRLVLLLHSASCSSHFFF